MIACVILKSLQTEFKTFEFIQSELEGRDDKLASNAIDNFSHSVNNRYPTT